jgi:hypothetical protein
MLKDDLDFARVSELSYKIRDFSAEQKYSPAELMYASIECYLNFVRHNYESGLLEKQHLIEQRDWLNSVFNDWSSEEIVIPYLYEVDKKYHRYFVDLKITFKDGKTLLVEIKPEKETTPPKNPGRKTKRYLNEGMTYIKNMNKWKAANTYAKDRGWQFQVWTEKTLQSMGILPKQMKKLPPLKKI